MKIGSVTIETPIVLGPMAGVTDLPFRVLCKELGAGLVVMEMVSAKGIYYNNRNTKELLRVDASEHPSALQLFGSEPLLMAEVVARLEQEEANSCLQYWDMIDINMGCPVPKVVKNGEGSALMRSPKLAADIIRSIKRATNKPVTAKIRKGFNDDEVNAVEVAKYLEDAGADAITVHGRTREQYYSGKADWDIIADVVQAVSIPVIGNGDVTSARKANEMFEYTGAAGVMISRAAMGNPWIFREAEAYIKTGEILPPPTAEEKKNLVRRHALMKIGQKGEFTGIREMRNQLIWYTAGMPHAARLRKEAGEIQSLADLERVLSKWTDA